MRKCNICSKEGDDNQMYSLSGYLWYCENHWDKELGISTVAADKYRRKKKYKDYLNSTAWKKLRKLKLEQCNCCEKCGSDFKLQVHHKHYRTFGNEDLGDLEVLCIGCHRKEHPSLRIPKWQ